MRDLSYEIKVSNKADRDLKTFLRNKVREYNREFSPEFKRLDEIKTLPLHIIVENEMLECVGGLTGRIIWDWLEVDYFWIEKQARGNGLGTEVLAKAEKKAKTLGASKILLMTFKFQARDFYEKQGYNVVGEIKDYPPGSAYYTLVKHLL